MGKSENFRIFILNTGEIEKLETYLSVWQKNVVRVVRKSSSWPNQKTPTFASSGLSQNQSTNLISLYTV